MAPFAKEKGEENCINQTDDDPREEKIHPTPVEGLKMVNLDEPEKVILIGATLLKDQAEALTFLRIEFK